MFTKQGKQILYKSAVFQNATSAMDFTNTIDVSFRNSNVTTAGTFTATRLENSSYVPGSGSSSTLMFRGLLVHYGIGTNEPTEDDIHFIENNIKTAYGSNLSYTGTTSSDITNTRYTWTHTITNNSTEVNFSITEAALIGFFQNSSSSNMSGSDVLMARDLLPEPLIINPGDTKSIVYTLDFSTLGSTTKIV